MSKYDKSQKNGQSGTELGVDIGLALLTKTNRETFSIRVVYPLAENINHAWDLISYRWTYDEHGNPASYPAEWNNGGKKVMKFDDLREISHYLEVISRFEGFEEPIGQVPGICQRLYEKELIRNLDELDDFWIGSNSDRETMDDLEGYLESISREYQDYKKSFPGRNTPRPTRKTTKIMLPRNKQGLCIRAANKGSRDRQPA